MSMNAKTVIRLVNRPFTKISKFELLRKLSDLFTGGLLQMNIIKVKDKPLKLKPL